MAEHPSLRDDSWRSLTMHCTAWLTHADGMGQGHLPDPTDEEIWKICDKANATEFINSFPNKLYTNVGERGVKLSGGQKQVRS